MTTNLPSQFDKYIQIHNIGEGGFGEVYRAVDTKLGRAVALKAPHRELMADPAFADQLRHEAQLAAQLDHPNIVRIYSIGDLPDGTPYIEMELVDGQSLADLLKEKRRLTPQEALTVIEGVCAALQEAHGKGIVHRDLKPQNILIRKSDGRVLVTDFGLAKATETSFQASLSSSNVVVGTFRYMPPEQANRQLGEPGPKSDLYSLGCILYEMLTGRAPFESSSVGQLVFEHATQSPEPPSNINVNLSGAVESVVLKALQKKPTDRFGAANEMSGALAAAVRQNRVVPGIFPDRKPVGEPIAPSAAPRSKRGVLTMAVMLAVSLIVVAVLATQLLSNDGASSSLTDAKIADSPSPPTMTPLVAATQTSSIAVSPEAVATSDPVVTSEEMVTPTDEAADAASLPEASGEAAAISSSATGPSQAKAAQTSSLPPIIVRNADLRMTLSAQQPDIPPAIMQAPPPYVIVEYGNLIQEQALSDLPASLLSLAAAVRFRPLVEQANLVQFSSIQPPPDTLGETATRVLPHVRLQYANTAQIMDLAFPAGLLTATGQ